MKSTHVPIIAMWLALWVSPCSSLASNSQGPGPALVEASDSDDIEPPIIRRTYTLRSEILGQTRRVHVAFPASFQKSRPDRRYPLIIAFDGGEPSARAVETAAAELSRNGLIPEAVVAGIENTDPYEGRLHDLTPPGLSISGSSLSEGGDQFLDFIERELIPALDRQFRTGPPLALIGHSSGGILATYAAATHPAFRLIVALDLPAQMGDDWLASQLITRARASKEPLRYTSYGARFGWDQETWKRIESVAPDTWKLHYEKLEHESHLSMPLLGAYLGLREIFMDYSIRAAPEYPTTSILPYYDALASVYGAPLTPPRAVLKNLVEDLLLEGRGKAARSAFDRLVAGYGAPSDSAELRGRITEVERRPAPSETVESLLGTPPPSIQEAKPYLGTWSGTEWATPEKRSSFELEITAENGRVTGKITMHPEPRVSLKQPIQYLTIQKDGFTYGFMNGMRPRGMILYPVRRKGDRFEGTMRWGGVNVVYPEGVTPPTMHVELRKSRDP